MKRVKVKKTIKKINKTSCHEQSQLENQYPNYRQELKRLSRVKGQLDGIERMINEGRYCVDIIYQIRASASALKSLEKEIMHMHIESCVKKAISSANESEVASKIQEIMDLY